MIIGLTLPRVTSLRKPRITPKNAGVGRVARMSDESWKECSEAWERVRWARRRKFSTAKDAADALGMKGGTYRAYERPPGSTKWSVLDHTYAGQFADKFKVRWEWLLQGEGAPYKESKQAALERVTRALLGATDEQADAAAELVERILGTGTSG